MPDIAAVFKSEISRLAKKTVRDQLHPLQSATTSHRRQLAALIKQVAELEREVSRLRRLTPLNAPPRPVESKKIRFVAKGLRSLRDRLDLSAEDFGRLLDVSGQTIYNWESQKTAPRSAQVSAIATLRGIGKKEAMKRLQGLVEESPAE